MNEIQRRNLRKKMEDLVLVPEAESSLHPIDLRGDGVEEGQSPEAAKQERGSGFIKHLISDLVTGGDADEDKHAQQAEKKTIAEGGRDEEKRGGLLDNIISSLVTPSSPKTGNIITQEKVEAFDGKTENESDFRSAEDVDGRGGLIKNFVSNLFHHSEDEVRESIQENKKAEMVKVGKENKAEKTEEGGGGIIDNIVSHLPTSLPDDAAPTTDEATLLIHIVQD